MFDARRLLDLLVQPQNGSMGASNLGNVINQVGSLVGAVLGQATSGLNQAATDLNTKTGIGQRAGDAFSQATGQNPADIVARAKNFVQNNQLATGAALGGIATMLLGTQTGREITGEVAQLGGYALIGGLAYKALQNYRSGSTNAASTAPAPQQQAVQAAPLTQEQTQAMKLIRVMIAASFADGRLDEAERSAILGNVKGAGLEAQAASFLENEFAHPADITTLCQEVNSEEEAAQIYAAARLAITPDTQAEQIFLANLASGLRIPPQLAANIDAVANEPRV